MEVDKFNNLLELYDFQYKNSKSDDEFLISLQNLKNTYTWEEAHQNIIKLSNRLNSIIKKNDRCINHKRNNHFTTKRRVPSKSFTWQRQRP